jgi:hypothetical protein
VADPQETELDSQAAAAASLDLGEVPAVNLGLVGAQNVRSAAGHVAFDPVAVGGLEGRQHPGT